MELLLPQRLEATDRDMNSRPSPLVLQPQELGSTDDDTASCTTVDSSSSDTSDEGPYFGDTKSTCPTSCFRLGCININNLPYLSDDKKNAELLRDIVDHGIDIALMQEIGINWSAMPRQHSWLSRVEHKFHHYKIKTQLQYNRHDKTGNWRQWGGTGIITHGKLYHCSMGAGGDASGLGRWAWARYQGKRGITL